MQSRWDNLVSLSAPAPAWMPGPALDRLRAVAAEVYSRTGCGTWIDVWRKEACFGYHAGGDTQIAWTVPLFRNGCTSAPNRFEITEPRHNDLSVDDICWVIQIGRADPAKKRRWEKWMREAGTNDRRQAMGRDVEDRVTHGSKDARREVQRMAMGRHYRGSAVVNGLKE